MLYCISRAYCRNAGLGHKLLSHKRQKSVSMTNPFDIIYEHKSKLRRYNIITSDSRIGRLPKRFVAVLTLTNNNMILYLPERI